MVKNRTRQEIVDSVKMRLCNALKGSALSLTTLWTDRMITPEERMKELEIIGEFKDYIENYEANMAMIKKYKDYEARLEDDGR